MVLLLRNFNVKHLAVRSNADMIDLNSFRELLLSKVQSANLIMVDSRLSARNFFNSPRLRVNRTLTVLNLRNLSGAIYDSIAVILAFCGALIHLSLEWVSNVVLQSIFKNQVHIIKLALFFYVVNFLPLSCKLNVTS